MTFSPFLCLIEEIMQCFFVNGAKIVFNSFCYNKSLKPKKQKKSIAIDFEETSDKTVNLKVDKGVWDDFLRLCSNSSYDRKTLVTQALYDFMKDHKDLL